MLFESGEIKAIMEANQEVKSNASGVVFIPKQHNDKHAAAKRYAIVEDMLIEWYHQVNGTNTRAMPADLVDLYNKACEILLDIKNREKEIILEGRE